MESLKLEKKIRAEIEITAPTDQPTEFEHSLNDSEKTKNLLIRHHFNNNLLKTFKIHRILWHHD